MGRRNLFSCHTHKWFSFLVWSYYQYHSCGLTIYCSLYPHRLFPLRSFSIAVFLQIDHISHFLKYRVDDWVYPQKDRNGKRPQWKKSMGIKTTVHSKTAWTILVIRPHQKRRPLVGMATKQVMPHHFFNNFAKGDPLYIKTYVFATREIILPSLFHLKRIGAMNNH